MTRRAWTYGEFHDMAARAASMLRAEAVGRGDRVAIVLTNSAEFASVYFGCLFIGAVAVPVNQSLHPDEIRYILARCGAKLLLFSRCTRPLVLQATEGLTTLRQVRVVLGQEESFHPEDVEDAWSLETGAVDPIGAPLDGVADDSQAIILFTSGTTGHPKGVVHPIASEFGNAVAFNDAMGFHADNRFLHIWPMAYSSGYLNTLLSPFMAGASVVLGCAFTAQTILSFWKPVIEYGANTLWLSPTMMASLLRLDRDEKGIAYCREKVTTVCVGTAPLALKLKNDFQQKYGVEALESYGLSELLIISANTPRHLRRANSVGRLLPGVELAIVDDAGGHIDGEGDMVVRTPFSMSGYLDLETNQIHPIDRRAWFPTGDIGRVEADGNVFITGRKKDVIIRGGQNLSPRAIRDVLLNHPAVNDAVVVGIPHDFYGEEIAAALKLQPGMQLADEQSSILQHCRRHLSQAAVPTRLAQIDDFPTGPTGKILSREVKAQLMNPVQAR